MSTGVRVRLNEANIQRRLRTDRGLNQDLELVGREVLAEARQNASGAIVGIQTGDLLAGLFSRHGQDELGPFVEVGSSAVHRGFAYPGFLDETGKPWLSLAARGVLGVRSVRRVGARNPFVV